MRVRQNPFSDFTPEQQVMGDKAEGLGFVWDRSRYPTPAWEYRSLLEELKYDSALFGISVTIWNRELRLWAADCTERVLPIWETWAISNLPPEHLYVPKSAIDAARRFTLGKLLKGELRDFMNASNFAAELAADLAFEPVSSVAFSAAHVANPFDNSSAAYAAYYAAFSIDSPPGLGSEVVWQRHALAQRIDAIAPWRLKI